MRFDRRLLFLGLVLIGLLPACGSDHGGTCVENWSPFVCGEDYTQAECKAKHGTWEGDKSCTSLN